MRAVYGKKVEARASCKGKREDWKPEVVEEGVGRSALIPCEGASALINSRRDRDCGIGAWDLLFSAVAAACWMMEGRSVSLRAVRCLLVCAVVRARGHQPTPVIITLPSSLVFSFSPRYAH